MPRLKPVGPASSNSSDFPQSKSMHSKHDYSDSFIPHIPKQSNSEEEEIEEPEIANPATSQNDRFTEIILVADCHYNPISVNQSPNPNWIIVTCDSNLIKHTPLYYTPKDNNTVGALVARGQLSVSDGQPILNVKAPTLPLTKEEAEVSSCLLSSFISEDEVAVEPFTFINNVEITEISSVFYSLTSYLTINNTYNTTNNLNYNSNFIFNQQNNQQNFVSNFSSILKYQNWSNQTNNIICNVFQNFPSEKDVARNDPHGRRFFFYFKEVNDRMIFFSSFYSTRDSELIDTKIENFDEIFLISDIDGLPFFEAKSNNTQKLNNTQSIYSHDTCLNRLPYTFHTDNTNLKNPRQSLLDQILPTETPISLLLQILLTHLSLKFQTIFRIHSQNLIQARLLPINLS